jgi:hypothetical protein
MEAESWWLLRDDLAANLTEDDDRSEFFGV